MSKSVACDNGFAKPNFDFIVIVFLFLKQYLVAEYSAVIVIYYYCKGTGGLLKVDHAEKSSRRIGNSHHEFHDYHS